MNVAIRGDIRAAWLASVFPVVPVARINVDMGRANAGTTFLLWLMLLAGGAALFACIFLPPWVEARQLRHDQEQAQRRVAELERQLTRLTKQIEHMKNDPAYLERLARLEFGTQTPGVEVVPVEIQPSPAMSSDERDESVEDTPAEELADELEQAARKEPIVSVFVLDQTRPIVMAMSGVLIIVALVSLIREYLAKSGRV